MKLILLIALVWCPFLGSAQQDNAALFEELKAQDSLFFERGFNQCDLEYLRWHTVEDLRFYHDQSGFQDKTAFLENTERYICAPGGTKPVRKVDPGSLAVFPLYDDGTLYGAVQHGIHYFYLRESGKNDMRTGVAKFTHVWVLQEGVWKLREVLSYDHHAATGDDSGSE